MGGCLGAFLGGVLPTLCKETLAAKWGNICQLSNWRKLRMSIRLIHRFRLRPVRKHLLPS